MKFQIVHSILAAVMLLSACSTPSVVQATPTFDPMQEQGYAVYKLRCAQCHALDPDATVIGPSLAGIATRAESRVPGYDARAYIETSILYPKDFLVDGFADTMPTNFGKELTSEEFAAVVAFLMTQK
ncbi:MAG: cytochrome c [Chloroflexi bacterium]|nr:cytochrome c [Chloroflexota bacterium]